MRPLLPQLVGCLLGIGVLASAVRRGEPENPFNLARTAAQVGPAGSFNYLLPLLELRRQRSAYQSGLQAGYYWQALATYAAMGGEPDSAAHYWRQQPGYSAPAPLAAPVGAPVPAAAAILAQTRQRQVVMFNEEHTQPRGRWLVGSLLPALYQQGFRYLALEALEATDSANLRQRGYPVVASGFYTNEPHFGNLIRQARQLGFQLVAYDAMTADRERDEARNLVAATLGPHPQARVLVLAGHGHINEASSAQALAAWVHQLTGIDPLTIEQTQAAQAGLGQWQHLPAGAYLVPAASIPARGLTCDLYVLNRLPLPLGNSFGQPTQPTRLALPADSLRPPQVLLVHWQREKQAQPGAEPVAVHCLRPGETSVSLSLVPGAYVAELRDAAGRRCWQRAFSVY
ncbi:hypothetical protein HHL22_13090 [Hymenobacter sp. RP-2-7]|uniref:Uncharacterized protein n=1 Tax=Hymenobacter polaris TaxID=2682546 RepID=A0A7Y0AF29_9BACT|nr:hypothetical protein [Hymenobacter polaris]NML66141.1 hypothetical protein [Hymenobacter polaris]